MPRSGPARPPLLVLILVATSACADPPEKEMQQAQGAIDAARSAGADEYARDEFMAAEAALQRAHEAVGLGDYRLALNHALDSRERARNSARLAADGRAAARVEADHTLTALTAALDEARTSLQLAKARRVPARTLGGAQRAIETAEKRVQEARTAYEEGQYAAVISIAAAPAAELAAAAQELESARPAGRKPR
jgi:hypothetical protein